jgi:hypothetical protein
MKKALKITLYSLLGIIVLALLGSYISYRSYWPDDPKVQVDSANLVYYNNSYDECREAFLQSVQKMTAGMDSSLSGKIAVPGEDTSLSIDWCYLPARQGKEKLLILNSGLHGIEGYTGSAIQQMFIEKILSQNIPDNMGVLLLHGLNPYGFKYHRKATGNNVDLNRNCILERESFDIKNEGFVELTDFLMPAHPVNVNDMDNQFFYLTAIYKILQKSMPVLRQAALQGQYEFEKGFYYGGKGYEPQIKALKPLLTEIIKQYPVALNVDLHTGYGERGTLHMFIDRPEDPAVVRAIGNIFDTTRIDWGSSSNFYTISGEYTVWVNHLVPETLCIPMVFEFGTLDSQKTFGSLKSMQIMILENQGAHYGYKNEKNEQKARKLFDELYYPASPVWRSKVIADSYEQLNTMMKKFGEYNKE